MSSEVMNVANSWWMYLLGAIIVLFVLGTSLFFIIKAKYTYNLRRPAEHMSM